MALVVEASQKLRLAADERPQLTEGSSADNVMSARQKWPLSPQPHFFSFFSDFFLPPATQASFIAAASPSQPSLSLIHVARSSLAGALPCPAPHHIQLLPHHTVSLSKLCAATHTQEDAALRRAALHHTLVTGGSEVVRGVSGRSDMTPATRPAQSSSVTESKRGRVSD